jgi:hypothetical protein
VLPDFGVWKREAQVSLDAGVYCFTFSIDRSPALVGRSLQKDMLALYSWGLLCGSCAVFAERVVINSRCPDVT